MRSISSPKNSTRRPWSSYEGWMRLDEPLQVPSHPVLRALVELDRHLAERLRASEAVDARDRRHDQDVAPLEERGGRRDAHLVDLVVDLRFLLDVGVRLRDVRLGLVVVVVRDEVLDAVLRKESLELLIELGRERLVVRQDERRAVQRLDDLRHRERLARARHAEEDLLLPALAIARDELLDRAGLIALRRQGGEELEVGHGVSAADP